MATPLPSETSSTTQPQEGSSPIPKKKKNTASRTAADPLAWEDTEKEVHTLLPFHEHPRGSTDDIKSLDAFHDEFGDDANEEDLVPALTKDVYSLLYTADLCGYAFNYALTIFLLQFFLLMLLFFNLVDTSSDPETTNGVQNRMKLPAGVEYAVTLAQFLGLLLAVMLMANDSDTIVEGYEKDIQYDSPNATRTRWFFSGFLQTFMGIMFVALSFILTMQSTDVLEIFLNLAGLAFLHEFGKWGFQLGLTGLVGRRAQKECEHVFYLKQLIPEATQNRIVYTKRAMLCLFTIGVLIPFGIFAVAQSKGTYLCQNIYIQFGDSYFPQYVYYSGVFEKAPTIFLDDIHNRRPVYIDATNTLQLAWCEAKNAWTISHSIGSRCEYIFKSQESLSFDVTDVAGTDWFVKTNQTGDFPVDWLALACNDCAENEERCNGECVENKCTNNDDPSLRGLNFEFPASTCSFFAADQTTTSSIYAISGASFFVDNYFFALPQTEVNHRLVYTTGNLSNNTTSVDPGDIVSAFLLFSGRRWIVFGFPQGLTTTLTYGELQTFTEKQNPETFPVQTLQIISSNPSFSAFRPIFFSSPVDYGTETYSVEPSAVTWLRAKEDPNESILGYRVDETKPLDVKLRCGGCNDETNPCENGGTCDSSPDCLGGDCASAEAGSCICPIFFGGLLCEYAIGCGEAENSCFDGGTCDTRTNICACEPGNLGNLCQYSSETVGDPFFCLEYECSDGFCNCTSFRPVEVEVEAEVENGNITSGGVATRPPNNALGNATESGDANIDSGNATVFGAENATGDDSV